MKGCLYGSLTVGSISGFTSISVIFFSSPSSLLCQQSHTQWGYCNLPLGNYHDTNIYLPRTSGDNLSGCIKLISLLALPAKFRNEHFVQLYK